MIFQCWYHVDNEDPGGAYNTLTQKHTFILFMIGISKNHTFLPVLNAVDRLLILEEALTNPYIIIVWIGVFLQEWWKSVRRGKHLLFRKIEGSGLIVYNTFFKCYLIYLVSGKYFK